MNVVIPGPINSGAKLIICDITGRVIHETEISGFVSEEKHLIVDMSGYQGIYIVSVIHDGQVIYGGKVVFY